jgi:3-dehydroquinate synthase
MKFSFGEYKTSVFLSHELPCIKNIAACFNMEFSNTCTFLVVCDENTSSIADMICTGSSAARCVLKSGEENKNWEAVKKILAAANEASLGRDGIFIGVGGGVIGDLCGFASSIYMRGCRLALVSTTLLGMVDASVGGKTGFDLFGIKNLAGSFYPAENVFMPLDCLSSLPEREMKSGMAELIKTAILSGGSFLEEIIRLTGLFSSTSSFQISNFDIQLLKNCVEKAVLYKGGIVSEDPRESGRRVLLNLGHTFAHALETAAGLGKVSHGEAVAWGIIRSCELGCALGVTPQTRAEKITQLVMSFNYDCAVPHPVCTNTELMLNAMKSDKKKKNGKLTFIVPDENSARPVTFEFESENEKILKNIIKGEFVFK